MLRGLITPRNEGFLVQNVQFYGYGSPGTASIGQCSHCFHPASTDSGARTVRFKGLLFDTDSANNKIKW